MNDPGEQWTYGPSTKVLGELVEKLSGQSLEQFFATRIFGPLGMTDTAYSVPSEKMERVTPVV